MESIWILFDLNISEGNINNVGCVRVSVLAVMHLVPEKLYDSKFT